MVTSPCIAPQLLETQKALVQELLGVIADSLHEFFFYAQRGVQDAITDSVTNPAHLASELCLMSGQLKAQRTPKYDGPANDVLRLLFASSNRQSRIVNIKLGGGMPITDEALRHPAKQG